MCDMRVVTRRVKHKAWNRFCIVLLFPITNVNMQSEPSTLNQIYQDRRDRNGATLRSILIPGQTSSTRVIFISDNINEGQQIDTLTTSNYKRFLPAVHTAPSTLCSAKARTHISRYTRKCIQV